MMAVAYIKRRGDGVSNTFTASQGSLVMMHEEEHLPARLTSAYSNERHCQQGVQDLIRQIGMETCTKDLQAHQCSVGPLLTDLFASHLSTQLATFVSWRPDPLAIAADAFTVNWSNLSQKIYAILYRT